MQKKQNSKLIFLILALIICLSFLVRVINIANVPSGFHADEASFYINALTILKTGADEDGIPFPLSLSSFIDPKPALFSYFQIPFMMVFKNYLLAARLPSVFLGVCSLILFYFLITELSEKKLATISTVILAFSPWHIIVSRGTQEVIASFFFLLISLFFLIKILKNSVEIKSKILLLQYVIFFIATFLSMYFYHSAKVFLPFICVAFLTYFFKKTKAYFLLTFSIITIIFVSGATSLVVQESSSRIAAVGIISDKAPLHQLTEQIYTLREELPIPLVRVFYNKYQAYLTAIFHEYLEYFSPQFLFLSGGKPQRYTVSDHGLLYLIELPLVLLGIYFAIKTDRKEFPLFIAILFTAPIPAALTTLETPSIIRSFPMVLSLAYLTALGIVFVNSLKPVIIRYIVLALISFIYLWQILYFSIQYHVQSKFDDPWYRNSPYTYIAKEVAQRIHQYDQIQVTNDLRPLYSYFVIENLIPITELQQNPHARDLETYSMGKFTFNRKVCDFDEIKPHVLYIAEKECRINNNKLRDLQVVKTITYDDDVAVYELLEVAE